MIRKECISIKLNDILYTWDVCIGVEWREARYIGLLVLKFNVDGAFRGNPKPKDVEDLE